MSRRRRVPTVQNSTVPVSEAGKIVSPLMACPISPPTSPKRSHATRWASVTAAMRRGCVTTMRGTSCAQKGLALRTRDSTSTSPSTSPPSWYFTVMVDLSSATSRMVHVYHTSSYSTSTRPSTVRSGPPWGSPSGHSNFHSRKSSRRNCGNCVDLPLPVPPLTTTTLLYSRALLMSARIFSAGSLPLISSRRHSSSSGLVTSQHRRATTPVCASPS
mmetsp:Transcript_56361/g.167679  ORF Transcript_56361/g.167679 Transcript_56361/m.167679 type:complete len:216 (-) Transcript_56361:1205-1852(-)